MIRTPNKNKRERDQTLANPKEVQVVLNSMDDNNAE